MSNSIYLFIIVWFQKKYLHLQEDVFFLGGEGAWDPPPPLNFQWPSFGVGMNIFWNYT